MLHPINAAAFHSMQCNHDKPIEKRQKSVLMPATKCIKHACFACFMQCQSKFKCAMQSVCINHFICISQPVSPGEWKKMQEPNLWHLDFGILDLCCRFVQSNLMALSNNMFLFSTSCWHSFWKLVQILLTKKMLALLVCHLCQHWHGNPTHAHPLSISSLGVWSWWVTAKVQLCSDKHCTFFSWVWSFCHCWSCLLCQEWWTHFQNLASEDCATSKPHATSTKLKVSFQCGSARWQCQHQMVENGKCVDCSPKFSSFCVVLKTKSAHKFQFQCERKVWGGCAIICATCVHLMMLSVFQLSLPAAQTAPCSFHTASGGVWKKLRSSTTGMTCLFCIGCPAVERDKKVGDFVMKLCSPHVAIQSEEIVSDKQTFVNLQNCAENKLHVTASINDHKCQRKFRQSRCTRWPKNLWGPVRACVCHWPQFQLLTFDSYSMVVKHSTQWSDA